MTVGTSRMTLADFLAYDDGTDQCYELENGEMILMPAESDINQRIASFTGIGFSGARTLCNDVELQFDQRNDARINYS
jgi:hypothetical protein